MLNRVLSTSRTPQRSNSQSNLDGRPSIPQRKWHTFKRSLSQGSSRDKSQNQPQYERRRAGSISEYPQLFRGDVHPSLRDTVELADLSSNERETFARILRNDPTVYQSSNEYHARTAALINDLDPRFKEPAKADSLMFARRLAARYHFGKDFGALPKPARLCNTHDQLNQHLILSIRICVEAYAKDNLQDLIGRLDAEKLKGLSVSTRRCLSALQDALIIIMRPHHWSTTFKREPPSRFRDKANKCDACYLGAISDGLRTMTGFVCMIRLSELARLCSRDACTVAASWAEACLSTWTKDKVARIQSTSATMISELSHALSLEEPQQASKDASPPALPKFASVVQDPVVSVPTADNYRANIPSRSALPPRSTEQALAFDSQEHAQARPRNMLPSARTRSRSQGMPLEVVEDALRAYRDYSRRPAAITDHESPKGFIKRVIPDPLRTKPAPMSPSERVDKLRSRIVRPSGCSSTSPVGSQKSFRRHAAFVGNEWPAINIYDSNDFTAPKTTPRQNDSSESLNPPWSSTTSPSVKMQEIEQELLAVLGQESDGAGSTPALTQASTCSESPYLDRRDGRP